MQRDNLNSIHDLLSQFLKEEGLEDGLLRTRVYSLWDELLGITVAKNTTQKYIKNRTLFVHLDSSVIRNQLFMMRHDIVKQINKQLGKEVISELRLN
jgi:predicted nucleic acid-binding Zn ribbon protein